MPKDPTINEAAFWAAIDPSLAALAIRRPELDWPWQGVSEDREVVHDALTAIYAKLGYPRPRFNWARSPFAMFGAMQYLRQMQTQQRQVVVREIMRGGNALEAEVRATFLEGILERDLTVSLGACLSSTILPGKEKQPIVLDELAEGLRRRFTPAPDGKPLPAGWKDWVLYPMKRPFNYALRTQTYCLFAFMRCVWICRPPQFIRTDDDGHLHCADGPAARWEDGYEVFSVYEAPERLPEPQDALALEESTTNQPLGLPAPQKEGV